MAALAWAVAAATENKGRGSGCSQLPAHNQGARVGARRPVCGSALKDEDLMMWWDENDARVVAHSLSQVSRPTQHGTLRPDGGLPAPAPMPAAYMAHL